MSQLLKPRVMSLVVFTALVGLLVAPVSVHPVDRRLRPILFIALGAGASGALNMWWDADIDAVMKRTMGRPVPSGRVQAGEALAIWAGAVGHLGGDAGAGANLVGGGAAGLHDLLLRGRLFDVAETRHAAEHRDRRGRRGVSADDRLGLSPPVGVDRSGPDVRPDLHVDAAAFLGAGAVHEGRLPQAPACRC